MDDFFSRVSAQYGLHQNKMYTQPPWAFTRTWATTRVERGDMLYLGAYTEGGRYFGLLWYHIITVIDLPRAPCPQSCPYSGQLGPCIGHTICTQPLVTQPAPAAQDSMRHVTYSPYRSICCMAIKVPNLRYHRKFYRANEKFVNQRRYCSLDAVSLSFLQ